MREFQFRVLHQDKKTNARVGEIVTPHGVIKTPAFVPVGTQATVKSLTPKELADLGTQLFFVNTYHAYLRPGTEVIKKFGGLHGFMGWQGPLITDSGGFQVFSLGKKKLVNIAISESAVLDREKFTKKLTKAEAVHHQVFPDDYRPVGELVKIDEDGVTFTSHWDGLQHRFTPERSIEIQHILGADITLAFDECPPYPTTRTYAQSAMERTHRWAVRSKAANDKLQMTNDKLKKPRQALYGVLQGSVFNDLRKKSARVISTMDFDGIAIGGVAVGESKKEMVDVLDWVTPILPEEKPRHLLGVGEIDDIFALVERGVDTFDCVQPTRLGRMGHVYVRSKIKNQKSKIQIKDQKYTIDITKKMYTQDASPVDPGCQCYTCAHFSRAYIHHLFRVKELLAYRLATIHNVWFMHRLVREIRGAIGEGKLLELKKKWVYDNRA